MTTTPGYTAEGHMALDTSLREFLGDDDLLPSILARAAELTAERASPAKDGGEQPCPIKLPVEVEAMEAEGGSGKYTAYQLVDADGRSVCDTLNCDNRITRLEEEYDEDSHRMWDEQSRLNMEAIAKVLNAAQPLASQMRPQSAVQRWQPIETAPKDDTEILVFVTDLGWRPAYWACGWDQPAWISPVNEDVYADAEVTHWMPLPAAPQPPQGEGKVDESDGRFYPDHSGHPAWLDENGKMVDRPPIKGYGGVPVDPDDPEVAC